MADSNEATDYKYVAYIDESGDPGVKTVKPLDNPGSSEWMIVAGVVVAAHREADVTPWAHELKTALNSSQLRDIHFQKLNPQRKLIACDHVASKPLRCFVVASNKQNMRGWQNPLAASIRSDNWFYCWMTRLLLERITHWVKSRSECEYGSAQRVKLVYSERGGLSYGQLNAYYQWLRMKGNNQVLPLGNLEYETINMRLMEVHNHVDHDGLKLPDIVASAFFKAADVYDTHACDPQFAKALRPRIARSPGKPRLISGYGVKLMPRLGHLAGRVKPEQLEIFRYYGYPRQWWRDGGPQ